MDQAVWHSDNFLDRIFGKVDFEKNISRQGLKNYLVGRDKQMSVFEYTKFCFLSEADSGSRIDLEETSEELQKNGK